MPPPLAPWSQAMLDLLDDGRWYDIDEVLAAGMAVIPPGRAIQIRERDAATCRTTGTGHRPPVTDDQRIRTGARTLSRQALDRLARRGRIHIDRQVRVVRKLP